MHKKIKISLHPLFILLTLFYFLIFTALFISSFTRDSFLPVAKTNLIISVFCLLFGIYFLLIRYRNLEINRDYIILKSLIFSKKIDRNNISSITRTPINYFNHKIGSYGIGGIISLTSGGENYNVSDLRKNVRIILKNGDILNISCNDPEILISLNNH